MNKVWIVRDYYDGDMAVYSSLEKAREDVLINYLNDVLEYSDDYSSEGIANTILTFLEKNYLDDCYDIHEEEVH